MFGHFNKTNPFVVVIIVLHFKKGLSCKIIIKNRPSVDFSGNRSNLTSFIYDSKRASASTV